MPVYMQRAQVVDGGETNEVQGAAAEHDGRHTDL